MRSGSRGERVLPCCAQDCAPPAGCGASVSTADQQREGGCGSDALVLVLTLMENGGGIHAGARSADGTGIVVADIAAVAAGSSAVREAPSALRVSGSH